MRLPSLLRRTPFRLTLLFLALFAAAASAILAWVYFASASEARTRAEREVRGEMQVLTGIYTERGFDALNRALIDRNLQKARESEMRARAGMETAAVSYALTVSPEDRALIAESFRRPPPSAMRRRGKGPDDLGPPPPAP